MGKATSNPVGPVTGDSLPLHLVSQTPSKITLGWALPSGILGYVFYVDGARVSNTWNPAQATATFSKKPGALYQVVAVKEAVSGRYQS